MLVVFSLFHIQYRIKTKTKKQKQCERWIHPRYKKAEKEIAK